MALPASHQARSTYGAHLSLHEDSTLRRLVGFACNLGVILGTAVLVVLDTAECGEDAGLGAERGATVTVAVRSERAASEADVPERRA